ncbi:MAG: ComEC/Rec2 family competence protein [Candidatus Uhrbacteria bacterium]
MRIRSDVVIAVCVGVLGGVASASVLFLYDVSLWFAALVSVAGGAAAMGMRGRRRTIGLVVFLACLIGIARFAVVVGSDVVLDAYAKQMVTIQGRVVNVATYTNGGSLVRLKEVTLHLPRGETQPIRLPVVLIAPSDATSFRYGNILQAPCRFVLAEDVQDRVGQAGVCRVQQRDDVRVLASGAGSPTLLALSRIRERLIGLTDTMLLNPASGMVQSALLNNRGAVDEDLRGAFRKTGTVHVLVVSGAHMSIIALLLGYCFRLLPIHRRTALWCAIATIAVFVLMVGCSASAIRGALMAIAVLSIELFGRVASPVRVLLLIATVMVIVHPAILAFSLAFQLSFAATFGILVLTPMIASLFPRWSGWMGESRDCFSASLAASISTAPLLMGAVGSIALIGPLINVPIILLLPAFLLSGIIFLAVAVIAPFVVAPFVYIVDMLARAMTWIVMRTADIPGTQFTVGALDWWFIAGIYVLVGMIIVYWSRQRGIALLSPFGLRTDRSPVRFMS